MPEWLFWWACSRVGGPFGTGGRDFYTRPRGAQVAPLAQTWCSFHVANLVVSLIRAACTGGTLGLLHETLCLSPLLIAYTVAALWMRAPGVQSEVGAPQRVSVVQLSADSECGTDSKCRQCRQ